MRLKMTRSRGKDIDHQSGHVEIHIDPFFIICMLNNASAWEEGPNQRMMTEAAEAALEQHEEDIEVWLMEGLYEVAAAADLMVGAKLAGEQTNDDHTDAEEVTA